MKGFTPMNLIKQYWPWILAILFAGVCGWLLGAKTIENQCNEYIYTNYVVPKISGAGEAFTNFTQFT